MSINWNLSGSYFETCNCEPACPCVFLSPPTTGECTLLIAWHIDNGKYGDVKLDDLNAVLAVHSPGHMAKVKWKVALYLDNKADQPQKDALTQIFSGQAGGNPAALGPSIGQVLGVKSVDIKYELNGKKRSLSIPNIAEAEIEALAGQDGSEVTIKNHPLTAVPGEPAVVAKSKRLSYHDYGLKWELSEKNGFYSPFRYKGP
ncbi:MAG TPA: DUF1326 domain-containing protein [Candidatus Bathyarchaeia archaeon]|nr:DUF1326 domain-containing protein [Candidatus Bathyarchaeia archaeon]